MLMQLLLLMVCAFWEVQAMKIRSDPQTKDSQTTNLHPFGYGADLEHKCLSWNVTWTPPKDSQKQIYFFDLGVETGQSTLLALGEDPHKACRYNEQWAQTIVPKGKRFHECVVESKKSLRILKAAQVELAKHIHSDLFTQSKIIMVEPSPAYSPVLKEITKQFPHRVQSFERAITGFNESTVNIPFSVKNKTIDPDVIKQAEQKGLPVVDVKGLNLMQLLSQTVSPEDFVIVKMDVEGSEYEILPCLVASSSIKLIDMFIIERHDWLPIAKTTGYIDQLNKALEKMKHHNIVVRSDWP